MKLKLQLISLFIMLATLAACSPVQEEDLTVSVVYTIGDEFALVQVSGYPPNKRLDEDMLKTWHVDYKKRLGVQKMDVLIYDQGKQKGDGVRAWISNDSAPGWPDIHIWKASNQEQALGFESMGPYFIIVTRLYSRLNGNLTKFVNDFTGKEIKIHFSIAHLVQIKPSQVCFDLESDDFADKAIRLCYDQQAAGLERFDSDYSVTWSTNCVLREVKDNLAWFDCDYLRKAF